jgi:hypothetical protein
LRARLVFTGWFLVVASLIAVGFFERADRSIWKSPFVIAIAVVLALLVVERIYTWQSRKRGVTTFLDRQILSFRDTMRFLGWVYLLLSICYLLCPFKLSGEQYSLADSFEIPNRLCALQADRTYRRN